MFSVSGVRNACPKCKFLGLYSSSRTGVSLSRFPQQPTLSFGLRASPRSQRLAVRSFGTTKALRQSELIPETKSAAAADADIEKTVRDAKQRFRDTLPAGYLNDEEYALYERLYGPPLRETRPEDVGVDTHADMEPGHSKPATEGTLLRQLEDGEFEEIVYEIKRTIADDDTPDAVENVSPDEVAQAIIERTPGYADAVARSPREHEALQRLVLDFKAAQKQQQEDEKKLAAAEEAEEAVEAQELVSDWLPEGAVENDFGDEEDLDVGEYRRFHPYTLDGRFHGSPVEMILPQEELVQPIRDLLDRTHLAHVKKAAQGAFGGVGLPTSPATPSWRKNGQMGGVGLPPDQRHMTEIEADAFIASYLPPAYASVQSILREVRKRVGSGWLQSRLKDTNGKELSVLDAGAGGAGLVAWDQVLQTEWELLKEKGEVTGPHPKGRRTVVVGSERLRNRLKTFLNETTFLPRLPDYEHSGETRGEHLDAGDKPQPRKSYDVIIASHLFLKEKQDHYRQAILNNLWSLLKPDGGVLIVIEKAHPRGFEAVAHVRDTLLKQFFLPRSGQPKVETEDVDPAFQRELEAGHIIAPCTNHQMCPMYQEPGKSKGRKDFCHFGQRFVRPAFYGQVLGNMDTRGEVEFSYLAIQRGVANDDHISGEDAADKAFAGYEKAAEEPAMQSLPRMVLPPLKRKGHVTIDLCTPAGKIERWTVPKSFSKLAYHDARKSRWGDLWALGAKTRVLRNVRAGKGLEVRVKGAGDGKKSRKGKDGRGDDLPPKELRNKASRAAQKRDKLRDMIAAQEAAADEDLGEMLDEELLMELEKEERSSRGGAQ
ncbi:putative S-adenosyl-L-methionine-dependent RNA methyltransferase RSM22 [Paramyrothecium foliicola]|nr:putative S-adenosyl-L-methionine-dependent RNA methyltransferase RSM22 [Paramyrothecium foliicola]